ncbi:MAG: hypothetical protein OXI87_16705 [Albidovulum sp.]|nr:hypothetical protein [Albidovulum sp.]MDE0531244.1 hypothetical protein [Albidovulum sp.]
MDRTVLELAARINLSLTRIEDALDRVRLNSNDPTEARDGDFAGNSSGVRNENIARLEEEAAALKAQLRSAENDLRKARMEIKSLMAICEMSNSEKTELQKSLKLKEDAFSSEIDAIKLERIAEVQQLDSILEELKPLLRENSDA